MNGDLSFGVSDTSALWMFEVLILEFKYSSRFSLGFSGFSLSDVVIFEIRVQSERVKAISIAFLFLLWIFCMII